MSNLFKNLKKNIVKNITPFELILKMHADAFFETFLNNNIELESDPELYPESDPESKLNNNSSNSSNSSNSNDSILVDTHLDSNINNKCEYESNININNKKISTVPIQQTFDEKLSDLGTFIYSPITNINSNDINSNNINSNDIKNINSNDINSNDINSNDINSNDNSDLDNKIQIFNDDLLINNLIILSNIEKYQKLSIIYNNTSSKLNFQIQIDDSYFPQLTRWYYNQNRTNTILTIDNLIDYSLQQYMYYNSTNNEFYIKKYNLLLNNAKEGLLNLKITYELDIENSLKITKIIEKITNL